MYNSILKGLKLKKDILATYRKRAIDARFLSLADNNKNINVGQEEWILQLPVCKVADTRLANVLYNQDVRTVKDLLEIVSGRGWKSLLRIEGVGKTSYYHLLSKPNKKAPTPYTSVASNPAALGAAPTGCIYPNFPSE